MVVDGWRVWASGAPDGHLVACMSALEGSMKANANFGALRLPRRPLLKASRTHPGGTSEKPKNAFRRGAVAILAMNPGAQVSNSCSVFHHDACIMKKNGALARVLASGGGNRGWKKKRRLARLWGAFFFKSERFVEAKRSFSRHH